MALDNGPIEAATKQLSEHYEVVLILVSNHEQGITSYAVRGSGNFFAREAMCQNYLDDQGNGRLATEINKDDDDGEDWKANKE